MQDGTICLDGDWNEEAGEDECIGGPTRFSPIHICTLIRIWEHCVGRGCIKLSRRELSEIWLDLVDAKGKLGRLGVCECSRVSQVTAFMDKTVPYLLSRCVANGADVVDVVEWISLVLKKCLDPEVDTGIVWLHCVVGKALRENPLAVEFVDMALVAARQEKGEDLQFSEIVRLCSTMLQPEEDHDSFASEIVALFGLGSARPIAISTFMVCCLGRLGRPVEVHLYDLSYGIVQSMSPWLLKGTIEGVWHTSIVVFGMEYYHNGNLVTGKPGDSVHGAPTKTVCLGVTYRRVEELHSFIVRNLRSFFNYQSYNLLENNCNHYSDCLAMWLCGVHIPNGIVEQTEPLKAIVPYVPRTLYTSLCMPCRELPFDVARSIALAKESQELVNSVFAI